MHAPVAGNNKLAIINNYVITQTTILIEEMRHLVPVLVYFGFDYTKYPAYLYGAGMKENSKCSETLTSEFQTELY